ncbi:MAG: MFS transporter [Rhodospirillaceae bacterium]|nr:MFS transporter [Rhodospirillaceae bacterium]MAX61862.1 MFS transporter [Rhodospirillaceae bacterium]
MPKCQTEYPAARIVGFSFLALAVAFSARAVLGLVASDIENELGWSRSFTSLSAASALMVMAVLAPIAGWFTDRKGARVVILLGLVCLGTGCLLLAMVTTPWSFFVVFSGLSSLGFGLVATHVVSTAVDQEVNSHKGLAVGTATSGATGGQFLILPLLGVVVAYFDWRLAFACLGVTTFILILAWVIRYPQTSPVGNVKERQRVSLDELKSDCISIIKSGAFHVLFWSYLICGYTTTGVIETHFLPYTAICGIGPVPSTFAYGLLSFVNLLGMILAGWLADRVNRVVLLGVIYIVRGLTFIILVNVGTSFEMLVLFSLIFGLVNYSTIPVTASLVSSHIGRNVAGLAFGLISAGHQIGAALGAMLGGVLFDLYLQYEEVWYSSLGLALLAGLLVFLLKEDNHASI